MRSLCNAAKDGAVRDAVAAHLRLLPAASQAFSRARPGSSTLQGEFCNALNDVALDDYIQVTFTVSSAVRAIEFRHPEMLSVEDYYLRYNFSKDFKPPHGMTHEQLVAALSRGFADIEADQQRSFEFDVTAGRFEVLDLSHKLLLIFFANGEPAEPQGTQIRLEFGSVHSSGSAYWAERHGPWRRALCVSTDGRS